MNILPGMDIPKSNQALATEYISTVLKRPEFKLHEGYFKNYLGKGYAVAMAHIRNAYIKHVLSNEWTQDKFDTILYVIVSNERQMTNQAFENMSEDYDSGKLKYDKFRADVTNDNITGTVDEMSEDDFMDWFQDILNK